MKAYRVSVSLPHPILKLGTAWKASGQCHTLATLSPRKQVLVQAEQENRWARVSLEYFGERKKISCPCWDLNPRLYSLWPSNYTDAIPALNYIL